MNPIKFTENKKMFSEIKKKILITGAGSYVGTSVEKWLLREPQKYQVDTLDLKKESWRDFDFSKYDVVYHVAGIAHADVGRVTIEQKKLYYQVNTKLAIETAEKAKASGVKQFIFMSSMIIYGNSVGVGKKQIINMKSVSRPANFYGDSKWQADKAIRELECLEFKVVVLRPPMIYGKGSKGNYSKLSNIAKKTLLFPDIDNKRSMLYIDNLCEFIKIIIDNEENGIFFPQNAEYTKTSEMVREIAKNQGKRLYLTKVLNPFVYIAAKIPGKIGGMVNKAFGNSIYEKEMSTYNKQSYQLVSLTQSIRKIESIENE